MTPRRLETDVVVVGAGPVGLTLAMDLARRGVAVTSSRRAGAASRRASSATTSRRARWRSSAASAWRGRCATPACRPTTRTTSPSAPRSRASSWRASPSPAGATATPPRGGPDTWWPTPEPPHRINQIFLEPILFAHAAAHARRDASSTARASRTSRRTTAGVRRARRATSTAARRSSIAARYLVGCDGGRSAVRRRSARRFHGDAGGPARAVDLHPRAATCSRCIPGKPAWAYYLAQPAPLRQRVSRSTAARPGWSTTTSSRTSPISTRSTATACDPHHPRRRRRLPTTT